MKIRFILSSLAGCVWLLGVSSVLAQTETPSSEPSKNAPAEVIDPNAAPLVTLDFQDVPIREALDRLFKTRLAAKYTLDSDVSKQTIKVNASFKNLPFDAVLNALLRSAHLRAVRSQGVYTISLRYPWIAYPPQTLLPPIPDAQLPDKVPVDFDFRIVQGKTALDTFKGIYTKDRVMDPSVTISMPLTPEDRLRFYRKFVSIHFFDYPKEFIIPKTMQMFPETSLQVEVRCNHQTITVKWDLVHPPDNLAERHLLEMPQLVQEIVQKKPSYLKLPPARGAYL